MMIPLKDEHPSEACRIGDRHIDDQRGHLCVRWLLGDIGFHVLNARYGAIPFEIMHGIDAISPTPIPIYLTLLSSMFMHGGILHLGGNMLYLWIFGNNIEAALGRARFLFFYLFCGIIATLSHVISEPASTIPMVGASGAIAGILGGYLAAFPGTRILVLVFYFILRVPALIVLGRLVRHTIAQCLKCQRHKRRGLVRPHSRIYRRLSADAANGRTKSRPKEYMNSGSIKSGSAVKKVACSKDGHATRRNIWIQLSYH